MLCKSPYSLPSLKMYSSWRRECKTHHLYLIIPVILTFSYLYSARAMKNHPWAFPSARSWTGLLHSWLNCRNHSLLTSWDHCAPPTTQLLLCRDTGLMNLRETRKDKIQKRRMRIWQMRMRQQVLTPRVCQSLDYSCCREYLTYVAESFLWVFTAWEDMFQDRLSVIIFDSFIDI